MVDPALVLGWDRNGTSPDHEPRENCATAAPACPAAGEGCGLSRASETFRSGAPYFEQAETSRSVMCARAAGEAPVRSGSQFLQKPFTPHDLLRLA